MHSSNLQIAKYIPLGKLTMIKPTVNTADNLFYLEYSVEKDGKYIFHLSFMTIKKAEEIFEKMHSWKMPVTLIQNRIILRTSVDNELGVAICEKGLNVEIRFPDSDKAAEFHDFIFPDNIKKMTNVKLEASKITFDKSAIINKLCFIDNRVMQPRIIVNKNLSFFIAAFQALQTIENFPTELKWLILSLIIKMKNQHLELHEKFSLHKQQINIIANRIIDCHISYAYNPGSNQESSNLYAFLTCANPNDAEYLFNNIKLHGTFKEMESWRNMVSSKHHG